MTPIIEAGPRAGEIKKTTTQLIKVLGCSFAEAFPRYQCGLKTGYPSDDRLFANDITISSFSLMAASGNDSIRKIREMRGAIKKIFDSWTDKRQAAVLQYRYGFFDGNYWTYQQIGFAFNISNERVRQIEHKALRKMRHPTLSKHLRGYW